MRIRSCELCSVARSPRGLCVLAGYTHCHVARAVPRRHARRFVQSRLRSATRSRVAGRRFALPFGRFGPAKRSTYSIACHVGYIGIPTCTLNTAELSASSLYRPTAVCYHSKAKRHTRVCVRGSGGGRSIPRYRVRLASILGTSCARYLLGIKGMCRSKVNPFYVHV